jgi:agmatine deiminase
MPAEWEHQTAIWLSWPYNEDTFGSFIEEVQEIFVKFIQALHKGQRICLLVNSLKLMEEAKQKLLKSNIDLGQIDFYSIPNVDVWFRDYGPTYVVNPKSKSPLAMVKWIFNAWGDKYDDLKLDNKIPYEMNDRLGLPMFETGIVLEGGSIDVNGTGTLLTSEQCLLNKNRNPHLSKEEIENYLTENLNLSKVLWLKEGVAGDDTDGHIDDIARFVNRNTVLCTYEKEPEDDNYEPLKHNYELLQTMTIEDGTPINVIKLPMPGPVYLDGQRYPASYANFYIGNDAVVVPIFGHANDQKALDIIQHAFPTRKVVGINCTVLVYGYGTLHCSSQQQPAS